MNLNFNFNGKTLLRNWWKIVEANFRTIQTVVTDHLNKFTEHKTAAELDHPNKSVKQKHIADKAIGQGQIADYAVGQTQLAQYSVSSAKIYPEAVQTSHIKDGNVTMPKLSQDLQDLVEELQNYSQTINLTFRDFDKDDNIEFYCGRNSRRFEKDGWVYWQSGTDEIVRSGPYNTESLQVTYYFAGLGTVSQKADAQKPIERLTIKADFGMTSGIIEEDGSNKIELYRVTENMSPIDREWGEIIPASEYRVIKKISNYLEVVFLEPITLQELSVAVDIGVEMFVNDEDDNGNDIPIEAYPGIAFKAEVKNDNPLDTKLSETSANGVENRAITAGIKEAQQAAVSEALQALQAVKDNLYGSPIHTYKFVLENSEPVSEYLGADEWELSLDFSTAKLYIDGKQITDLLGNIGNTTVEAYKNEGFYINLTYDAELESLKLWRREDEEGEERVPPFVSKNGFTIPLYSIYIDADGNMTFDYAMNNADSTGETYTVLMNYTTPQRQLTDLHSENKNSFLDAVNENIDKITKLTNEISGIDMAMKTMRSLLGTLSAELDSVNGVEEE